MSSVHILVISNLEILLHLNTVDQSNFVYDGLFYELDAVRYKNYVIESNECSLFYDTLIPGI